MLMKKATILLIITFAFLGIFLGLIFTNQFSKSPGVLSQTYQPAPTAIAVQPSSQLQPQAADPQTLSIPKLNITADIEAVGEDNIGRMDIPKKVNDVGWYSLGYKPGEKGSAVIDGHLDTVTGAPSVFYYLSQLSPGDEVIVTDQNGKNLNFAVTDVQNYPFDQVPLQKVFASNDKPRLNLITCIGVWNTGSRNYSNRLVVYTELKSR